MINLAVLIDAENMPASIASKLFKKILTFGAAPIRRIYGNWASPHLQEWSGILDKFAIKPIHQPNYVTGKNVSDMALIIDAMDLLHHCPKIDGFCIVSSDSDFTLLALHLRESQKTVYGFGRTNTPDAFKNACHQFIVMEANKNEAKNNIQQPTPTVKVVKEKTVNVESIESKTTAISKPIAIQADKVEPIKQAPSTNTNQTKASKPYTPQELQKDKNLLAKIKTATDAVQSQVDKTGYILLSRLATQLKQVGFDKAQYGYAQLNTLIKATDLFEVKSVNKQYYVKLKIAMK